MARVKDSVIEAALRRIVRAAITKDEAVTVKQARSQAEKELKLGEGFLLGNEWRSRSRDIVKATFEESEGEREPETTTTPVPAKMNDSGRSAEKQKKRGVNGVQKKVEPAIAPATASLPGGKEQGHGGEEGSEESDSEDENESEVEAMRQNAPSPGQKKPQNVPNQVNGVKRKASAQSDEDGSDSESEDESTSEPPAKKSKASASTDAGLSHKSNSSGVPTSPEQAQIRPIAPTDGETVQASQSSLQAIPPQKFTPPWGYTPLEPSHLSESTALSASDLEGKEIWHIAAPSNLPLSSLSELTMDAINSPNAIITINGLDYTLTSDPSLSLASTSTLLLPTSSGYRPTKRPIARTLKLQQRITLPNITSRQTNPATGSSAAGNIAQAPVSTVRPQPKGLRMRYRPPGFGAGKLGALGSGSDSASEDEQVRRGSAFQFPKALGAHGTEKRKVGEVDVDMLDADASPKIRKEKKEMSRKKKEKSGGGVVEETQTKTQTQVNGIAEHSPLPTHAQAGAEKSTTSNLADVLPTNAVDNENLTQAQADVEKDSDKAKRREEKARRREEKRLKRERKEAKRKAKEEAATLLSS